MTEQTDNDGATTALYRRDGRVLSASGPVIRASGTFSIGEICLVSRVGQSDLRAEVIGFAEDSAVLTPFGSLEGVSHYSRIRSESARFVLPISEESTGRILDAVGQPFDGGSALPIVTNSPARARSPNPMTRRVIDTPFETGIRAIDSILTVGVGQRLGIFASAGGGKSTLLSMLVNFAKFDRCIVALIGERGREVREFVEHSLGADGMARSTLFVATSDSPAIEQVNAAYSATTLAEYYRKKGERVLLLMDSLTRFARAQRQIGLSAGEPPTRRGFPPSVFEKLPVLLERTGNDDRGSITAFYTVLVEGDDMTEPVADEVRSLLDGHIILSRKLGEAGHYPAIDVLASASRVFNQIVEKQQQMAANHLRKLLSKYNESEFLIRVGEYEEGSDQLTDLAVQRKPGIDQFLQQRFDDPTEFSKTRDGLIRIVS